MSKLWNAVVAVLALATPLTAAHAAAAGIDPAACRADSHTPAVLVKVQGFKSISGNLRVQVYGSDPAQFVKGGERVLRADFPVRGAPAEVCIALPAPGRYAIAVRHDADGNGKGGVNDGGGFSRNPGISLADALARRMPRYEDVAVMVGGGPRAIDIVLNYRQGLSIRPLAMVRSRTASN
jgi:uncharacterized protein (DUF2141 family)